MNTPIIDPDHINHFKLASAPYSFRTLSNELLSLILQDMVMLDSEPRDLWLLFAVAWPAVGTGE